jgi:Fe-S oxidoreductase
MRGRAARAHGGTPVVLWPDTFNDHFHPETAKAAAELLESAGFDVRIPSRRVCCGRPLYDYGLLPLARRMLLDVLDVIRDEIRAGLPVIVLEPSCAAVFRDEMVNMLPNDQDAIRLSRQVSLLGEFVRSHQNRFRLPSIKARVLFHAHCHEKAVFDARTDAELLRALGAEVDAPDTGCCGMAGSFGFEAGHYGVSMAVGERVLLPSVRNAAPDTVIVSDGFSCREQIHQATGRDGLHIAEVLRLAQQDALGGKRPERQVRIDYAAQAPARIAALTAAAMVIAGVSLTIRELTTRT